MTRQSFGDQLRLWRQRRHLSQQALADRADLSARHLSFIETGRSTPSREMVLRLAERLSVPLRERNPMLEAAGYAPMYRRSPLDAPEMQAARRSLDIVLRSHLPNPALAFDRFYNVVAANQAVGALLQGAQPDLLANSHQRHQGQPAPAWSGLPHCQLPAVAQAHREPAAAATRADR